MAHSYDMNDRTFFLSCSVITVFGFLRLANATPESFLSYESTLSSAYLTFVGSNQATYLYVPLCAFCVGGLVSIHFSACRLSRSGSRKSVLRCVEDQILLRGVAFATAVSVPSVFALALKSGVGAGAEELLLFSLLQLLYESVFFVVVGLVFLAAWLLTRSSVISMVLTVAYGASDTFIAALGGYHGEYWCGWMLMGYADPGNSPMALAGLLRLGAFALFLYVLARHLMRRVDFCEEVRHD